MQQEVKTWRIDLTANAARSIWTNCPWFVSNSDTNPAPFMSYKGRLARLYVKITAVGPVGATFGATENATLFALNGGAFPTANGDGWPLELGAQVHLQTSGSARVDVFGVLL
jgi:hypothetical protein